MYLKRKSDGRVFRSVGDAVDAFRCPGPCDPDCPLYPLKPTAEDENELVHMCHPSYREAHIFSVADAIGCQVVHETLPETDESARGRVVIPSDALPPGTDVTVDATALAREIAAALNSTSRANLRTIAGVLTNPKCAPRTPTAPKGR